MRSLLLTVLALTALAAALAATAGALRIEFGNTVVGTSADVLPRKLPARGGAPVKLTTVTRVSTKDGSIPPALSRLRLQFDKHGWIETEGVAVCTVARLTETTTRVARKRCRGALVGTGTAKARVQLPGQGPRTIGSPLSLFNGPRRKGLPTLIVHAYETVPTPQPLLIPIVVERVAHGRYGYRVEVDVPEIAGGYGAAVFAKATLGRTFRGGKVGYVNASCVGGRLQIYGTASFVNGDFFPSTLASTCSVRR